MTDPADPDAPDTGTEGQRDLLTRAATLIAALVATLGLTATAYTAVVSGGTTTVLLNENQLATWSVFFLGVGVGLLVIGATLARDDWRTIWFTGAGHRLKAQRRFQWRHVTMVLGAFLLLVGFALGALAVNQTADKRFQPFIQAAVTSDYRLRGSVTTRTLRIDDRIAIDVAGRLQGARDGWVNLLSAQVGQGLGTPSDATGEPAAEEPGVVVRVPIDIPMTPGEFDRIRIVAWEPQPSLEGERTAEGDPSADLPEDPPACPATPQYRPLLACLHLVLPPVERGAVLTVDYLDPTMRSAFVRVQDTVSPPMERFVSIVVIDAAGEPAVRAERVLNPSRGGRLDAAFRVALAAGDQRICATYGSSRTGIPDTHCPPGSSSDGSPVPGLSAWLSEALPPPSSPVPSPSPPLAPEDPPESRPPGAPPLG
jgi:hypothetical protein